jgi:hypothetical protein
MNMVAAIMAIIGCSLAPALAVEKGTGTDPRDFANKFMPYYLYGELENGLEFSEFHLFGLYAITPKWAFTYDLPVYKDIQWDSSDSGLPRDVDESGVGDFNLRTFLPVGEEKFAGMSWLVGAEFNFPTHSEDALGTDQTTAGPIIVNIYDATFLPMPGAFLAMIHIFNFDIDKDDDVSSTSLYKGRWFFMTPLNKKHKLYSLVEMQPVYDFKEDEFSYWVAPEFGKAFDWGAAYLKPGFGIDNDLDSDRETTFEVGCRYFF